MCCKLGRASFLQRLPTKGHGTKGKTYYGFFKRLFDYWDIPTSSKKMPFLVIFNYVNNSKTCT